MRLEFLEKKTVISMQIQEKTRNRQISDCGFLLEGYQLKLKGVDQVNSLINTIDSLQIELG